MVTSTVAFGLALANVGPLTSTYTAPASCTSPANVHLIVTSAATLELLSACPTTVPTPIQPECTPSGNKIKALTDPVPNARPLPYYSPGLYCPDRWTTAGVAIKDAHGSVSSTGAFLPQSTSTLSNAIFVDPPVNFLMDALDNGETAVVCCPSGYDVRAANGDCTTSVPRTDYAESTACGYGGPVANLTTSVVDYYGTKVTETAAPIYPTTSIYYTRQVITVSSTEGRAINVVNMITLVHQASDAPTSDAATSTSASASASATKKSAASGQMRLGSGSSLAAVLASCTVATLVGFALMVPM